MSRLFDWAKREIELAKKREREASGVEDGWDYGCACYDSALKAYESLCEDGHSGLSIGITKQILNRLIDGKVLTVIEDTPDIWNQVGTHEYQCKRMPSLFKEVDENGNVSYRDNNYAIGVNVGNDALAYHSKLVSNYVYSKYPITMPYYPNSRPYKVYCEDFVYKKPDAVGEYDALLYMIKPNGEREEVNKYFMEQDNETIEIDKKLYEKHKKETFG